MPGAAANSMTETGTTTSEMEIMGATTIEMEIMEAMIASLTMGETIMVGMIIRTLTMEGMIRRMVVETADVLQEIVIGITIADAADPGVAAEATIAGVEVGAGAEAEALVTGGDVEAAAIPVMDTDLGVVTTAGLLVIPGGAPPTVIRTIPRCFLRRPMVSLSPQ